MTEFTPGPNDFIAQRLQIRGSEGKCFTLSWAHQQYYLPGKPDVTLSAVCYLDDHTWQCAITDDEAALANAFEASQTVTRDPYKTFLETADKLGIQTLDLSAPLPLETVVVPKPWGREIWYTGIEARGVCKIKGTPIPWLLSMAPELLAGHQQDVEPILLKILDPLPDEVYGDLYFELHEQKTEVYVVTHVNQAAWPDGTGRIRYGFDESALSQFDSEKEFRQAYMQSVNAYRTVRAQVDEQLDQYRQAAGYASDEVVSPVELEAWKAKLEPALNEKERQCRGTMDAFTALHPLEVGDVVQVRPLTPHALQHGVRVIEFQTPHYERYILSFAQKVLTQSHWDTEVAAAKARLSADLNPELTRVSESPGHHQVDIIADFEQFEVYRVTLAPDATWSLPSTDTYLIVAGVNGRNRIGSLLLEAEQACYIPASTESLAIVNTDNGQSIALVALPGTNREL
ncbi:MAG: hypothetical protein WD356_09975 [Pseudomonadales bacterium]